jgi:hypothetical protein
LFKTHVDIKNRSSDEESDYYFDYCYNIRTSAPVHQTKKIKLEHKIAELSIDTLDQHNNTVAIHALLDSGTTGTLLLREYMSNRKLKGYKGKPVKWFSLGGNYITKCKALIQFKLPELSLNKTINWIWHAGDINNKVYAQYHMIIGSDLKTELGINILYSDQLIKWEGNGLPMKPRGYLHEMTRVNAIYHMELEPEGLKEAKE